MSALVWDQINMIKNITFKKLWNLILLHFSYRYTKTFNRQLNLGKPFSLSIEPTTSCNLGCPECPSGLKQFSRPTGRLKVDEHVKMLDEIDSSVFYINYYFQGEPFLNPHFLELIKEAKRRKIYTATSTNAHFINEKKSKEIVKSGLDRLIISIDGLTQETYEGYRKKGKLNKVIEGTKNLIQAKKELKSKTPHLIFQFLAVSYNEHEIPKILEFGKEIGVNETRIKTAQIYDYKNGNNLIPKNLRYSRYKLNSNGTYVLKHKLSNHCWRMWSGAVITWDGGVVPCCFDKDASHQMGNLLEEKFDSIWNNKRYNNFRSQLISNRSDIDICKNCTEGAKVFD